MMKWSDNEINLLKKLYCSTSNEEISKILKRSKNSIWNKASNLGLRKTKEYISKCISKRNKIVGRDLTNENLKNIALKYNTRSELQINDPSVYKTALDIGILDEICSHMIKQNYSIPQLILKYMIENILPNDNILYNSRKIIKPYELDIYIDSYKIAFEYDGKGWHSTKECWKRDKEKEFLCKKKGILLIRLIENNRNYIEDIKNQLILNLSDLNKKCNKNIRKEQIQNFKKEEIYESFNKELINIDKIMTIIDKYDNYSDFRKKEISLYNKLCRSNLLHYLDKLNRERITWSDDKCIKIISNYNNLKQFREENFGCYQHIKRFKKDYLFKQFKNG